MGNRQTRNHFDLLFFGGNQTVNKFYKICPVIRQRNSSPMWLLFSRTQTQRTAEMAVGSTPCSVCSVCSADTDLPTDSRARDRIDRSIDYKYTLRFLPVHLLRVRSSANASLYTQVTCDLSLNTDSHTGFFQATAVGLCPPTCNERCTRVLHLLPLKSYACVLIALFCVVFHPTRAVHNLDLRVVSNCTGYKPTVASGMWHEQWRATDTQVFYTNTRGFSRSKLFSSVECSRYRLRGIPYVVATQAMK